MAVDPQARLNPTQVETLEDLITRANLSGIGDIGDLAGKIDGGFQRYRLDSSFDAEFTTVREIEADVRRLLISYDAQLESARKVPNTTLPEKMSDMREIKESYLLGEMDLDRLRTEFNKGRHDLAFNESTKLVFGSEAKPDDIRILAQTDPKIEYLTKAPDKKVPNPHKTLESEQGKMGSGLGIMVFGVVFAVLGTSLLTDSGGKEENQRMGLTQSDPQGVLSTFSDIKMNLSKTTGERSLILQDIDNTSQNSQ